MILFKLCLSQSYEFIGNFERGYIMTNSSSRRTRENNRSLITFFQEWNLFYFFFLLKKDTCDVLMQFKVSSSVSENVTGIDMQDKWLSVPDRVQMTDINEALSPSIKSWCLLKFVSVLVSGSYDCYILL